MPVLSHLICQLLQDPIEFLMSGGGIICKHLNPIAPPQRFRFCLPSRALHAHQCKVSGSDRRSEREAAQIIRNTFDAGTDKKQCAGKEQSLHQPREERSRRNHCLIVGGSDEYGIRLIKRAVELEQKTGLLGPRILQQSQKQILPRNRSLVSVIHVDKAPNL